MKMTIDEGGFIRAFQYMGRGYQFSREALALLFDYYDEVDPDMELDVISICCDWTEYETTDELKDGENVETLEELEKKTTVLTNYRENGPFVVANY